MELAEAYVSLVVDTRNIPRQVRQGFGQAAPEAARAGQEYGSKFSSAFGTIVKGGAATAAAAAAGVVGTALTKGFERLTAIDDAQAKLRGLGNDAQSVSAIMDSALAAVKGTAYGLGDAATIAASAVAAGIKPGEELTNYLKLTADAASIAGSSLGDMGHILNKVQTSGKAYTDDLNMLSDRGIPIFQWLRDEYGKSAEEFSKMVEQGQVKSDVFQKVIEKNIGGAALKMGDSFKGSVQNLNASLGRLGAGALEPFFKRLQGGAADGTNEIDKLTPKVKELSKALDNKVFNEWGPKLKAALQTPEAQKQIKSLEDSFRQIGKSVKDIAPTLGPIVSTLAKAAGSTGFSALKIGVEAFSDTLKVASPVLKTFAEFVEKNQDLATGLLSAWMAFKSVNVVQGYLGNLAGSVGILGTKADAAGGKAALLGQAIGKLAVGGAVVGLGMLSQKTDEYGQKTDSAKAATIGFDALLGAMAGSTLGPAGAVAGAAAGTGLALVQMFKEGSREAKILDDLLKSQLQTMDQMTGRQTQQTIDSTAKWLKDHGDRINQARGFGIDGNRYVRAGSGLDSDYLNNVNTDLRANILKDDRFKYWSERHSEVSADTLAQALQGIPDAVAKIQGGQGALDMIRERLGNVAQASADLSKAMNTEAEANTKASDAAQQYIRDTKGQFEATDSLKAKFSELGAAITAVPQSNVVEITAPAGMDPETFKNKVTDLHLGLTELEADKKTVKVTLDDKEAQDGIKKLQQQEIPPKQLQVSLALQMINNAAVAAGKDPVIPPQPRAKGGPISGAGTGESDSIPALLSHGEHVWTKREVDAVGGQGAMYNLRSRALAGGLRFATGGGVMPTGISDAIKAAQEAEGHTYEWGGVGLNNFDCSGFVGFLQQVAMGLGKVAKRLYTTNTLIGGATAGLESGLGDSNTWFKVGVSGEHMAATIAGLNVESGGQYGTSGIGGGRAGASDSQFPYKFHLPNKLVAGFGQLVSGGSIATWTDENERELERLQIAVTDAKTKRDEVYAKSDSSDTDKHKADLDVADAQDRVVKKQEEKDKAGQSVGGSRVAPQAPALSKKYTDTEKSYASNLQAVESANKQRNQVYDDPTSTEADKQVADITLQKAIDKLENQDSNSTSKNPAKTVKDIFTTWASSVAGVAFDAFKSQLPDKISGSHWWSVADQAVALVNTEDSETGTSVSQALQNIGTFGASAFADQLGYNPKNQIPDWVKNLKSAAVYDTGGWLPPGGMAVNLSSSPEPIFNSPKQLRDFAGGQLQPAQGDNKGFMTEADMDRYMRLRPVYNITTADVSGAVQQIRVEQKRQAAGYMRR
ncbi:tape measure protein [Nocardia sp. NPDC101769]|uniref:tape measure protein n=1 Tax=Nocardia sp. NPDC101769 TaxID=3364333 RepID=UPI003824D342